MKNELMVRSDDPATCREAPDLDVSRLCSLVSPAVGATYGALVMAHRFGSLAASDLDALLSSISDDWWMQLDVGAGDLSADDLRSVAYNAIVAAAGDGEVDPVMLLRVPEVMSSLQKEWLPEAIARHSQLMLEYRSRRSEASIDHRRQSRGMKLPFKIVSTREGLLYNRLALYLIGEQHLVRAVLSLILNTMAGQCEEGEDVPLGLLHLAENRKSTVSGVSTDSKWVTAGIGRSRKSSAKWREDSPVWPIPLDLLVIDNGWLVCPSVGQLSCRDVTRGLRRVAVQLRPERPRVVVGLPLSSGTSFRLDSPDAVAMRSSGTVACVTAVGGEAGSVQVKVSNTDFTWTTTMEELEMLAR